MKQRIQAKDLINVGIFTAIMFVVCMGVAMLGYIPIFIPLLSVLVPLIGGIPFMLFLTKVKKFGMVTIMSILIGILIGLMGMGVWVIVVAPVSGILADFIFKSGGYASAKKSILGYGVFSIWVIGNFIPIVVTRDNYFNMLISGYGREYAETLMKYIPDWSLIPLLAACFISGLLGAVLGRALLKKHFVRAGIV
ncbi:MptD family putative ECF transporter S component [Faecalicatena contorta]|uniref:DNA-3-methyladenine glycosylase III n=1 Tax=Faecalicatena contorta TaxID=39482 RepID=A0A316A1G5_9FIRM|nr:MptD family putative ECF transporter S component [Faecalicatena contorta]PWJ51068.1 DNA-3-methyladenine glycosylase III [Faecalicatena contorta]SUQ13636.1 DNA-3-methyladenine glycosylase III [Faecalicatena contorta]